MILLSLVLAGAGLFYMKRRRQGFFLTAVAFFRGGWKGDRDNCAPQYFDLEDPLSLARLDEAMTALRSLTGLVVIDEVQRRPELFPILRVLADREPLPARFLILGSATPALLRQSSESLAGHLETVYIGGLTSADAPRLTHSMRTALTVLSLDRLLVIYPGDRRYALAENVEVIPFIESIKAQAASA